MCFRLPATGGAPWTSTQDSFAAVRAQRTWKAVAYEWRRGLAAKEYIIFMIQPGSPGQACAHTLRVDQNCGT